MRTVTVTEAKNGLSALIDAVQGGETVLIIDRGRPVARLDSAISASRDDAGGRLVRLERAGLVRRGAGSPAERSAVDIPRHRAQSSAVTALIEERRSGR